MKRTCPVRDTLGKLRKVTAKQRTGDANAVCDNPAHGAVFCQWWQCRHEIRYLTGEKR